MDMIRVQKEESQPQSNQEIEQPLLQDPQGQPQKPPKTITQKAVRKTFKGTANLSSLLPTGSVLIFEFLSPITTNKRKCNSLQNQLLTIALLAFCSISCFIMRFTDSVRDEKGKIRYGFITFNGIWIPDGSVTLTPEEAAEYRIGFRDFVHAFLSVVVFMVVALFDQNVVGCFIPAPTEEVKDMLVNLPAAIGVFCCSLFLLFPSRRHSLGQTPAKN